MSYDSKEISLQSGEPLEYYEFIIGLDRYYYNTGISTVVVDDVSYLPAPIKRSKLMLGKESGQSSVDIRLPNNVSPADRFIHMAPGQACSVTIFRQHRTDSANERMVLYKGVVRSASYSGQGFITELHVAPRTRGVGHTIPPRTYQSLCSHILFDDGCRLQEASYRHKTTVNSISGKKITVASVNGQPDHYYDGGFVKYNSLDYRLILSQVGNELTLLAAFQSNVTGQEVEIYVGCDHSINTCHSKFDNVTNYGGSAFVPNRNPFEVGID